jgi:hypothetical protein
MTIQFRLQQWSFLWLDEITLSSKKGGNLIFNVKLSPFAWRFENFTQSMNFLIEYQITSLYEEKVHNLVWFYIIIKHITVVTLNEY